MALAVFIAFDVARLQPVVATLRVVSQHVGKAVGLQFLPHQEAAGAFKIRPTRVSCVHKVKSELLADSVSDGFEVSVETHDGVVALEGTLPDQDVIDHVLELARSVDGVRRVDGSALLMTERG
jgi:hypothetical protein